VKIADYAVSISYVEPQNLTTRMSTRRRATRDRTLWVICFNFVRVRQTLYEASDGRRNVGHVQSIEEIVEPIGALTLAADGGNLRRVIRCNRQHGYICLCYSVLREAL
jgi:hypothetical protein